MRNTLKLFMLGLMVLCGILLMNSQVFAAVTVPNSEAVGTPGEQLKAALEAGESVTLTQNITDLASTIEISDTVTIDGAGHTIEVSTFEKVINLLEGANVTLKNVTIRNTFADGRCIDIREGGTKLTLEGATVETTKTATNSGHDRPINVGGNFENPIDIIIKDSNITAGKAGYAIMVFNPINLKIDNSKITGYTTLYLKAPDNSAGSAGSVINVVNGSVLNGKNDNTGSDDDFGVIVFEDDNIAINVENSTVKATGTGSALQYIFTQGDGLVQNNISVKGNSEIAVKDGFTDNTSTNKVLEVGIGVTSNVQIPEKYLSEDVEIKDLGNGNYEIVVATYKVKIDDVEYTVEAGKTVKDIAEYNNIIKKDGHNFKGFKTLEGQEWDEATKINANVELKTVFEEIKEEEEQPPVEDDKEQEDKEEKPNDDENKKEEDKPTTDNKPTGNDGKDKVPKTGVESNALTIFGIIAIVSLIGLALTKNKRK